ncbi:MAG: LysR family transcriptional regulator [Myxococcota bacterium]
MDPAQLDLNKLHTFARVADDGGVTAAARGLGLTPSAVSQGLAALEAQLGVALFHRVGRRLVLTREGAALHRRFAEIRDRLSLALAEALNAEREVRGPVRLGVYLGFPREPLARLIAGFAAAHPDASVRVRYEGRDELERGLRSGRLDLAFALERARGRGIESLRLFRQELVLVRRREKARRALRFQDLAGLAFVDYFPAAPLIQRWIRHHFRRKPPRLDVRVWAASANLALDLVRRGVGAAVLPEALVGAQPASARLERLSGGRTEMVDSVWLNALPGSLASPAVDAFRRDALAVLGDT